MIPVSAHCDPGGLSRVQVNPGGPRRVQVGPGEPRRVQASPSKTTQSSLSPAPPLGRSGPLWIDWMDASELLKCQRQRRGIIERYEVFADLGGEVSLERHRLRRGVRVLRDAHGVLDLVEGLGECHLRHKHFS